MTGRIELLVHAGAPSGRRDDDRRKAQAEAYLAFHGARIALSQVDDQPTISPRGRQLDGSGHEMDGTTVIESPTVFLDDTQLAINGLDSQLLTSSLPFAQGWHSGEPHALANSGETDKAPCSSGEGSRHEAKSASELLLTPARPFAKRKRDENANELSYASEHSDQGTEVAQNQNMETHRTASSTDPSLSSYLKTPILDRSAKKARPTHPPHGEPRFNLPTFALASDAPLSVPKHTVQHTAVLDKPPAPAATAPAAVIRSEDSRAVSEPTSELPTSYSLSDITSESSRARVRVASRSMSDSVLLDKPAGNSSPGHIDSSTITGSNGTRFGDRVSDPNAQGDEQKSVKSTPEVVEILDESQVDRAPANRPVSGLGTRLDTGPKFPQPARVEQNVVRPSTSAPVSAAVDEAVRTLGTLSSSIHAPEPEVSIKHFTTHVTPALASLASNQDMAGRYAPVTVTRDLRALERGHWLFDGSLLPAERQVKLWQFLNQSITNGGLGWGIWCERDGGADGLGIVKVYCWGEVVEHVYLLLYVGSSSQIRKLGAQWIDAEGVTVVRMRRQTAVAADRRA